MDIVSSTGIIVGSNFGASLSKPGIKSALSQLGGVLGNTHALHFYESAPWAREGSGWGVTFFDWSSLDARDQDRFTESYLIDFQGVEGAITEVEGDEDDDDASNVRWTHKGWVPFGVIGLADELPEEADLEELVELGACREKRASDGTDRLGFAADGRCLCLLG